MNSLFLRTCNADGTSYGGFQWPTVVGEVAEAPNWDAKPKCGYGLHGLLMGEGDGSLLDWNVGAIWYVCEALGPIVDIDGDKIKTSKAKVLFIGDRKGATNFLIENGADSSKVVGAFITVGDDETAIGGDWTSVVGGSRSTVFAGRKSTVTGGDDSTVIGGNDSIVTGGKWSIVTGGKWSIVTGGHQSIVTGEQYSTVTGGDDSIVTGGNDSIVTGGQSTVTGGHHSTVTGGHHSTVTGGHHSTVTGGDDSTVTGGNCSIVTGGEGSIVTGGINSVLSLKFYDGTRYRIITAYVGEDGIEPNVPYKLDDSGKFVKAE